MTNTTAVPTSPNGGGSAAAQAYRAELARKGETPTSTALAPLATVAGATPATPHPREARTTVRKKVSGRATLALPGGITLRGKLVDVSESGACILMDEAVQPKRVCTLTCDIFHSGKNISFTTSAASIYNVLASGQGFKVGFHWGKLEGSAGQAMSALLGAA